MNKTNDSKTDVPGERLYFDISSIKGESAGGKKFWLLVVDEATGFPWSFFLKKKDELKGHMMTLVNELHKKDIKVKTFRCDNAGENKDFEKVIKNSKYDIKFEYTAPGTPQQNGVVERKFAT
eukprot:scaffold10145_cov84-Amphora_coffeaeformis.AAC.1